MKSGGTSGKREREMVKVDLTIDAKSESGKAFLVRVGTLPLPKATPVFTWLPVSQVEAKGNRITAVNSFLLQGWRNVHLGELDD